MAELSPDPRQVDCLAGYIRKVTGLRMLGADPVELAEYLIREGVRVPMPDDRRLEASCVSVALTWSADHATGKATLLLDGEVPLAELDQAALAVFLDATADAVEFLSGAATVTKKLTAVEDFEARTPWGDAMLLGGAGWTTMVEANGTTSSNTEYWRQPGHPEERLSAKTIRDMGKDWLYVFTDHTLFPANEPISKLRAYALLHHEDDLSIAVERLRQLGFGGHYQEAPKEECWSAEETDCRDPDHEGKTCDEYDAYLGAGSLLVVSDEGKLDLSKAQVEQAGFIEGQFETFRQWCLDNANRGQLRRQALEGDRHVER